MDPINGIGSFFKAIQGGFKQARTGYKATDLATEIAQIVAKDITLKNSDELGTGVIRAFSGLTDSIAAIGAKSKTVNLGEISEQVKKLHEAGFKKGSYMDDLSLAAEKYGFDLNSFSEVKNGQRVLREDVDLSKIDRKYGYWDRVKNAHRDYETGEYSATKMIGTAVGGYVGASSAYRLVSGGGLYKDADGNTNIIGIPGI